MEEYDVTFAEGVAALGGARRCRLRILTSGATAVLLRSLEDDQASLLLGRVEQVSPDTVFEMTAGERAALGLPPDGGRVCVFCRMTIPHEDPLSAGFDLSRLVLTAPDTGLALETERPGLPLVPIQQSTSKAARSMRCE